MVSVSKERQILLVDCRQLLEFDRAFYKFTFRQKGQVPYFGESV